jgi:hypothetical protein
MSSDGIQKRGRVAPARDFTARVLRVLGGFDPAMGRAAHPATRAALDHLEDEISAVLRARDDRAKSVKDR